MRHLFFPALALLALSCIEALAPIDLGAAQSYAILAGSAVTTSGAVNSVVTGDVGVYPGTAITGFPPAILTGDLESPLTGTVAFTAQAALLSAYTVAASASPAIPTAGDLGSMVLTSGVYSFVAAASLNGVLTLDAEGDTAAVWIIQVGSAMLFGADSSVVIVNGGSPEHVYWQIGSAATLLPGSSVVGNIMAYSAITATAVTVNGRLLALNAACTITSSFITNPSSPRPPTSQPTSQPSSLPSAQPTSTPSSQPSAQPTTAPSTNTTAFVFDLGAASTYSILAGSTITNIGNSVVYGDMGLYPGSAVTGFGTAITYGKLDIANPAALAAQGAVTVAYNTAAGLPADAVLFADLGGMTLPPGVYKFPAAASLNGVLTLDAEGDIGAVWTFQVGSSMLFAGQSQVQFVNGLGNPNNVVWQVGSSATIMGGVTVVGNILAFAAITSTAQSTVNGRLFAKTAVTLIQDYVNIPGRTLAIAPISGPDSNSASSSRSSLSLIIPTVVGTAWLCFF